MTARRIARGRIDRSRIIHFTFDGRRYSGHPGETLACALLANGVSLFGRSFKYHRPRGLLAAGVDEPNALVTVLRGANREPNIQATTIEIHDELEAVSQNCFPSLAFDIGAISQLAAKLMPAGFYYKTFMGPAVGRLKGTHFWMFCEYFIRRSAGLGRAGLISGNAHYEHMNAFCDVLVIGSGPAGLMAAMSAADKGRKVMLVELDPQFGGSANWSGETIGKMAADEWAKQMVSELSTRPNVCLLARSTAWGYYDGNNIAVLERVADHKARPDKGEPQHRHWFIRAGSVVLATGAFERPLVFPGNDRPGVMLASAAQRYANEFGVLAGERIVVFTNNDSAYKAAAALSNAGATIAAIVDLRSSLSDAAREAASRMKAELLIGHAVASVRGAKGLNSVKIQPYDSASSTFSSAPRTIAADLLIVSGGWSPTIHLASQAGGKPEWDNALQAFLPPAPEQNWVGAGAFNGVFSTHDALEQGCKAGLAASGCDEPAGPLPETEDSDLHPCPSSVIEVRAKGKAFVDFQHDVTAADIRLARQEGFESLEHLKRYTTLGMATDQGKTSNVPGLAIMAQASGIAIADAGTTRFRPPFTPVSIGSLAGARLDCLRAERLTPMHDWHVENGATMTAAGLWLRPQIYGQPGETIEQAYLREALAVRKSVGITDMSTLGKIAVKGPDSAIFLDRIYTNVLSTLSVGKARYGLMLREDGFVLDDGTVWRLGEDDFLITTTTANAGKVLEHIEYLLDVIWPSLKVTITSVTDEWAAMALAGPNARKVLEACVEGTPVDKTVLPPMGIVHGRIGDVVVMIGRLSFSGELAYEIYCPAGFGAYVWEKLLAAGKAFAITPYGVEALDALRIEKGHVASSEINGQTTAKDLHLDWIISRKKPFVGSAMMNRKGLVANDRLQLVGLVALDNRALHGGGHIVEVSNREEPRDSIGHVTSACHAPALRKYIALALVRNGKSRMGTRAFVSDPLRDRFGPVEIVNHHFFDPKGIFTHD